MTEKVRMAKTRRCLAMLWSIVLSGEDWSPEVRELLDDAWIEVDNVETMASGARHERDRRVCGKQNRIHMSDGKSILQTDHCRWELALPDSGEVISGMTPNEVLDKYRSKFKTQSGDGQRTGIYI